jgi:hypothetical protein
MMNKEKPSEEGLTVRAAGGILMFADKQDGKHHTILSCKSPDTASRRRQNAHTVTAGREQRASGFVSKPTQQRRVTKASTGRREGTRKNASATDSLVKA